MSGVAPRARVRPSRQAGLPAIAYRGRAPVAKGRAMPGFPDDERFSFDRDGMDWREEQHRAALSGPYRELYLNHLDIALVLSRMAGRTRAQFDSPGDFPGSAMYVKALEQVAARLRQADYVPGNEEIPA